MQLRGGLRRGLRRGLRWQLTSLRGQGWLLVRAPLPRRRLSSSGACPCHAPFLCLFGRLGMRGLGCVGCGAGPRAARVKLGDARAHIGGSGRRREGRGLRRGGR